MVIFMANRSKKLPGAVSHPSSTEHNARGTFSTVQRLATGFRSSAPAGPNCLPTAGKDLPAEIDDALLKIARVLARQAAREDHARQEVGSAYPHISRMWTENTLS